VSPSDFAPIRVGSNSLIDRIQTRGCTTPRTVVEGGLQFEGCLRRVDTIAEIPQAERGIIFPMGTALRYPLNADKVRNIVIHLSDVYVSYGPVKVNGLTLSPGQAASILVASQFDRIVSSDAATSVGAIDLNAPRSFMIDPATGLETPIAASVWRPIVDPAGDRAVAWVGTVKASADGLATVPASGALVLRAFTPDAGPLASSIAGSTASPDAGSPASPDAGATVSPDAPQVVADGPVGEFDVRWDETGSWFAVWVADATDPTVGQLSLVHLDRASGRLDRPRGAPQDVTALPGFSIADGRLAWATPPGQGGEGSRVQIVAWTNETVGAVESGPVEDVVVVH